MHGRQMRLSGCSGRRGGAREERKRDLLPHALILELMLLVTKCWCLWEHEFGSGLVEGYGSQMEGLSGDGEV